MFVVMTKKMRYAKKALEDILEDFLWNCLIFVESVHFHLPTKICSLILHWIKKRVQPVSSCCFSFINVKVNCLGNACLSCILIGWKGKANLNSRLICITRFHNNNALRIFDMKKEGCLIILSIGEWWLLGMGTSSNIIRVNQFPWVYVEQILLYHQTTSDALKGSVRAVVLNILARRTPTIHINPFWAPKTLNKVWLFALTFILQPWVWSRYGLVH